MPDEAGGIPALWDWRRRVAASYASARAGVGEAAAMRWRADREALFRGHPQSPLPAGQGGVPCYFPYDGALRFTVGLRPLSGAPLRMDAGTDGAVDLQLFAATEGLAGALGQELTLYWIAGYGGGAFLPFADATNGRGSYGGGRYVLDTIKGADLGVDGSGRTVVDFNYAYNPSCSYSDRYVCPLPPPGNRLPTAVCAGEAWPIGS